MTGFYIKFLILVEGEGVEPSKASAGRFTVCSLWPLGHPSKKKWHPQGDLNPCRQDENLVSWTTRR